MPRYISYSVPGGAWKIMRIFDGASVLLQGEEAAGFGIATADCTQSQHDEICSAYDEVMRVQ